MLKESVKDQEDELVLIKKRVNKYYFHLVRELKDSQDYAITKIAKEIVEVADNIKRCKKLCNDLYKDSQDPYIVKIMESEQKLSEFFSKYGIKEFDPMNEAFNPNTQEAMVEIPCQPGYTAGNVAIVMRTGYTIKDRLLRSARVGVFC